MNKRNENENNNEINMKWRNENNHIESEENRENK